MMMLSASDPELFQAAHRVWTQFNTGLPLATADVALLKNTARAEERRLRIDVLACNIIQRELA
jgi:hypothetical protein